MITYIRRILFKRGWLVKVPHWSLTYRKLLQNLKENKAFSFSRWGDGEWESVLSLKSQDESNCDGHKFFSSMQIALHEILLKRPSYYLGMQELAYYKTIGNQVDKFLKANKIKLDWENADALHFASVKGELNSFFQCLVNRKLLLVGPAYLKKVEVIKFDLIEVPQTNCWLAKDDILSSIMLRKDNYEVVLFCAGMTSNWLVDQLHGNFNGFIIDIGSLLDPYAGKETRNYHRKLKI